MLENVKRWLLGSCVSAAKVTFGILNIETSGLTMHDEV